MKLKTFKEQNNKKIGIIIFTISCLLLVTGVFLYKSFALFAINEEKNIINGNVEEMGDIYFAFYVDDTLQKEMPSKESGLVLDDAKSYCGVSGQKDEKIKVNLTEDYVVQVSGMTSSRTKCNLYFTKGKFILGKGVPLVENGSGLYEVNHDGVIITDDQSIEVEGWDNKEYRYAGPSTEVNNYVDFNNEKWRIIGLVNVLTTEDIVEQRVKIIKNDSYMKAVWHSGNRMWQGAELQKTLNGEYLNSMPNKDMIATDIRWNVGEYTGGYDASRTAFLTANWYKFERTPFQDELLPNNNGIWDGQVALMYASDYGYGTIGGNTTTRDQCLTVALDNWGREYDEEISPGIKSTIDCPQNNWLYHPENDQWTLSQETTESFRYIVTIRNIYGYLVEQGPNTPDIDVYPALYLKPDVQIVGGSGTITDSFKLAKK